MAEPGADAPLPASWRDHEDRPADAPPPPDADAPAVYAPIGDFQGAGYARNAFAQGTAAEVAALRHELALEPGHRVLDVGCGDGRHLRALAEDGVRGVGVDVSAGLLGAARAAADEAGLVGLAWVRGDARRLPVRPAAVDAALSVCQGGFGTSPTTDPAVLAGTVAAVRPGGRVAVTAFHALFAARHLVPGDVYDPVHGVHHHTAEVVGPDREVRRFPLWTSAYTVGELVRLAEDAGLAVERVAGVEPGRYDGRDVGLDDPELLLVGVRR